LESVFPHCAISTTEADAKLDELTAELGLQS
jgi:hypothetical protein